MEVTIEKCGIRINSPAFVIVYRMGEKLRRRVLPLRNFGAGLNIDFIALELKEKEILHTVPLNKIKKMLRLLQELLNGTNMSESVAKVNREFELKLNEDLNKLSTDEIELQKKLMDSLFLKNQIKKDDTNFIYDKRVDFTENKTESTWDLEPCDDFWD